MLDLLSYAGRLPAVRPTKPTPTRAPTTTAPIATPAPRPAAPSTVFERLYSKRTTAAAPHQRVNPTSRPLNGPTQAQGSTNAQR
jgi:hypothetical protein